MDSNGSAKVGQKRDRESGSQGEGPVLCGGRIRYEVSQRVRAVGWGGLGLMSQLADHLGIAESIDRQVQVLRRHLPYRESDHVLSLIFNLLSGGRCLQDAEDKRLDEAYCEALGAERLPAPSTSGDFLRRFGERDVEALQRAFEQVRLRVWKAQPKKRRKLALIDVDGTQAETEGRCKEGIGRSYKGVWGYAPLALTLANTQEVLYVVNRPGNRPSHDGAVLWMGRAAELARRGGFERVLLRGDTDFSLTGGFDGWDEEGHWFVFGKDAHPTLAARAQELDDSRWQPLQRPAKSKGLRKRRVRYRDRIVAQRGYRNRKLNREEVAEWKHRPGKCKKEYRLIALRKTISVKEGQRRLFDETRYFFYISNAPAESLSAAEVVRHSNKRCNQEKIIEQLGNGVPALRLPSDSLLSNWAWMVIAAQAWNLKSWLGLTLPEGLGGRRLIRMHFRRFLDSLLRIPCQILRRGGQPIHRLLSSSEWTPLLVQGSAWMQRSRAPG